MLRFLMGLAIGLWLMWGLVSLYVLPQHDKLIGTQRLLIEELKKHYQPPRPPGPRENWGKVEG